jgi:hypothetical protein
MANFVTVIHECRDYATWKTAYDSDAGNRAAAGLTDIHALRDQDNPNVLALVFGVSDMGRAKAFVAAPELAATMKAAGITGVPRIRFRQGDYTPAAADHFATMTLTVRDYAMARDAYAMDAGDRKTSPVAHVDGG